MKSYSVFGKQGKNITRNFAAINTLVTQHDWMNRSSYGEVFCIKGSV